MHESRNARSGRSRSLGGAVAAVFVAAVFGAGAPGAGQTLYNEDGVRVRVSLRPVAYAAGRCEVSEPNLTGDV